MRVLLDTCVLSEIRKKKGSSVVKNAVQTFSNTDLFLSVITIGEIVKGIELLGSSKRKKELTAWVQGLERDFSESILSIDIETVIIWGDLTASAQKSGKTVPACDGLIAATAKRHGLHLMTRNVIDFEPTGAMIFNPWE
jgi:toxin FitB